MATRTADADPENLVRALTEELAALKARTQWLIDRTEIQDLLNAYCRAIDHGDVALLKQFYHPDAIDEHGIFSGTGDGFAEATTAPDGTARLFRSMQHHHTTTSIAIAGDEAEAETYFLCVCARPNDDLQFSSGRVADRFEKRDGRWGVVHRQVIMDWTWAVRDVEVLASDGAYVKGRHDLQDISRVLLPRLVAGGFHPGRRPRPPEG